MGAQRAVGCGMGAKFWKTGRDEMGKQRGGKILHAAHDLTVSSSLGD